MKTKPMSEKIKELLSQPGFQGHRAPRTRRDFIKLGLIAGGGALMPASIWQKISATEGGASPIPFLVFDCAGGASMPGNFLVGKTGGPEDLCENYRMHGWNPRTSTLDKTFGLPMSGERSQILAGIKAALQGSALIQPGQNQIRMGSFCNFSLDDSSANRISALTLISKAGARGRYLKNGVGQRATSSGGNSDSFLSDPRFRPTTIASPDDVLKMLEVGDGNDNLDPGQRKQLFAKLQKSTNDPALKAYYQQLDEMALGSAQIDVNNNPDISAVYGLNQGIGSPVEAGIVYNVIQGNTGPGVITIEGCDYHDNTQQTGDMRDLQIGTSIGRALRTAELLKKPLFFQIITDGGVYAQRSDNYERVWAGDRNLHSLTVIGYYNPNKPVEQIKQQVGYYTDAGELDVASFMGMAPDKMVNGVLVNYLNVQGKLDQLNAITGLRPSTAELDQLLMFT